MDDENMILLLYWDMQVSFGKANSMTHFLFFKADSEANLSYNKTLFLNKVLTEVLR